jgi:hypothetical protein
VDGDQSTIDQNDNYHESWRVSLGFGCLSLQLFCYFSVAVSVFAPSKLLERNCGVYMCRN